MKFKRSSGILLHPTSLPGAYGIGDLGAQARKWVDFLADAGCNLWQVLPLGPTGYGDSPYQCFSAFAGNTYLISPEDLQADGLLAPEDLEPSPAFPDAKVDFGKVIPWKLSWLNRAFQRFREHPAKNMLKELEDFRARHASWLEDFACFMAIKTACGGLPWADWEQSLRDREPATLEKFRIESSLEIDRQIFYQFLFHRQWMALRDYAHQKGILIIGDAPIFVAHDSADVWVHRELFYLNRKGKPSIVAGVPPDYFSPTGQLWGNPLYRWKTHKSSGYRWWIARVREVLQLVDLVRLDHFRGFAGYWAVSGKAKTAEKGRWLKAPGRDFLRSLRESLGDLPIIAEDLGVITPDVVRLRDEFNLPGMKILQFGFAGGPADPFLPHNYPRHCVVYTGTHDNDTVRGWYERVPEQEKAFYRRYLDRSGDHVAWDLIRACWASVAAYAIAPMQNFLELGNEARMNFPGTSSGNWTWRLSEGALTQALQERIRELNYLYLRGVNGD